MPEGRTRVEEISGRSLELSNLDKVLFPNDGITKGELIDYYRRVASIALPHYRDRPLTMHRYPDGIAKKGFFQKDIPDHFPEWIDRARLDKENGSVTHVVVNEPATLAYLADQGCVTPHLGLARIDKPDHPDRAIFDLDPSDDDFGKVQTAAKLLKSHLDKLELPSYVQTTGSRGLHVLVPLDRGADFDTVRDFTRAVAERLADANPDVVTVAHRKNKRGARVFIDYLRNAYGQTAVAPYGVRALEGAPVATPLSWREATASGLSPRKYTVKNLFRRLSQVDDPWSDIRRRGVSISAARRRFSALS